MHVAAKNSNICACGCKNDKKVGGILSKNREIRKVLIDTETGEEVILYEGDRITRKNSLDYLSDTEILGIDSFFKGNVEELKLLLPELSTTEKAFLISIAPYVGYSDCCLKHGNNIDMLPVHMEQIVGLSMRSIYSVLESLIKKDIVYKGKNSNGRQYFVNPLLFNKGARHNKVLRTMFKNYKVRSRGSIKWKDIVN